MKVRKSLVLAGLAGGIAASSAMAQTIVYNNTTTALPNLTGAVAAGAANGYELGDEVVLACGPRELTEITIVFHVLGTTPGTADTQVRIYAGGAAPSIPLWDSGVIPAVPHTAGLNNYVLPVPNVVVPDEVIWTIQHTNRTGSTLNAMGPRLYNPPTVGTSEDFFWALDAPTFPGWNTLFYNGSPVANFGSRLVASGTVGSGACCLPDGSCQVMTECDCENQDGLYQGDSTLCSQVFCRDPGACCLPIGDCFITAQHLCEAQGGTYAGDAVTCAAANCELPGACCLPGNECVIMTANECTLANGTFNGAGSQCGPVSCAPLPILLNNGPLSTGEFHSGTFAQAPAGTTWSEITGVPGCANVNFGYAVTASRLADNFIVPEPWTIDEIDVFGYVTLTTPQNPPVSPFTGGNLRIWDGVPGAPGSNIVFGDTTTNRLTSSQFANIYRVAGATNELRPVFRNTLSVGTTLQPGTYWVDYRLTSAGTGFSPPVSILTMRGPSGANALQQVGGAGAWTAVVDLGACEIPRAQDTAFIIYGELGGAVCYANCDESTQNPILNVDDFTCFINEYASAQALTPAQQITAYANCDGSTVSPVLNVDDFTCFINEFAAGCP